EPVPSVCLTGGSIIARCTFTVDGRHRDPPEPCRIRGAAPEIPLRTGGGEPRRTRRREGGVVSGGDRRPLCRPLLARAALVAARVRGTSDGRRRARAPL